MSVIDKLNEVQTIRQNKYSLALKKSPLEKVADQKVESVPTAVSVVQPPSLKPQVWMVKGILVLLVLLTCAVSFVIVLLLKREKQPQPIELVKPETKIAAEPNVKSAATTHVSRPKAATPEASKPLKRAKTKKSIKQATTGVPSIRE
jgi:hypothetical protein